MGGHDLGGGGNGSVRGKARQESGRHDEHLGRDNRRHDTGLGGRHRHGTAREGAMGEGRRCSIGHARRCGSTHTSCAASRRATQWPYYQALVSTINLGYRTVGTISVALARPGSGVHPDALAGERTERSWLETPSCCTPLAPPGPPRPLLALIARDGAESAWPANWRPQRLALPGKNAANCGHTFPRLTRASVCKSESKFKVGPPSPPVCDASLRIE